MFELLNRIAQLHTISLHIFGAFIHKLVAFIVVLLNLHTPRPVCRSVVHSLPDSPFSLTSPLTLSNHLLLGPPPSLPPPLYLHFQRHSSYAVLFSSHHMPVPVPHPILDFIAIAHPFRCFDPLFFHSLSCRAW